MDLEFKVPDFDEIVRTVAREFQVRVARRTPVRTGKARNSWVVQPIGKYVRVTNDTPYINYLENGTYKMRPFYMIRLTMEELPSIVKEAWLSSNMKAPK